MKVVVTGGAGFVGTHLCKELLRLGHEVVVVGPHLPQRRLQGAAYVQSDLTDGNIPSVFAECEGIIHLAGANILHRWTPSYKQLIFDSRVKTALAIHRFLSNQKKRPKVFISASAIGLYGDRGEELLDEHSAPGTDFLSSVCVAWEKAAQKFSSLGMRAVSIRTAAVLSPEGGTLSKMVPLFKWGLGATLGKGSQWFPWIHIDDLIHAYTQALMDERIAGPINAAAPGLIRNREFTQSLGSVLHRPAFLRVPRWLLRAALGEFSTVLLSSQRVVPKALTDLGFSFSYPTIEGALESLN